MAPKDQLFNHIHNDVRRADYRPDPYKVTDVDLYIKLHETRTHVRNRMVVEPNPAAQQQGGPLILQGEEMDLDSFRIKENGRWRDLDRSEFFVDDKQLMLLRPPHGRFELEVQNVINPSTNTALMGIYKTGDIIGSQNESRGYRRITYYLDRSDNLAKFTTTLEANKKKYPIMISNGNGDELITTDVGNGRHKITWNDPFPKPSYLFATIAGAMKIVQDSFRTIDDHDVQAHDVKLRGVVPPGYENQMEWAMTWLKHSLKWDEDKYGNAYDLDILHIIGLEKFNMGAMENKGALVFNIKDLVGSPETTTYTQLIRIAGVIAHELYHNRSGDRVTIRDFFEISQKESLTELRNEQFQTDFFGGAIQTIDNAISLRTVQFREDAGPTAHCIRPEVAESFENIYSPTVYHKGSQVLRQLSILLGDDVWYPAIKHHFTVNDGKACTVEDLVQAIQDYSGKDLTQYSNWWHQTGTPQVSYEGTYDAKAKTYTLTLKQHTDNAPGEPASLKKKPQEIAVKMGLISESGKDIPLVCDGITGSPTTGVLDFTQAEQTFVFKGVDGPVVPSLFRDFSAPVKVVTQPSDDELLFRMTHDSDDFNRWDACDTLMNKEMLRLFEAQKAGKPLKMRQEIIDAYGLVISSATEGNLSLNSRMLQLPAFAKDLKGFNPDDVSAVSKHVRETLANTYKDQFLDIYKATTMPKDKVLEVNVDEIGRSELHNQSLGFIAAADKDLGQKLAEAQYDETVLMSRIKTVTDADGTMCFVVGDDGKVEQEVYKGTVMDSRVAALRVLCALGGESAEKHLEAFHEQYKNDTNVVDLWLGASASVKEATPAVQNLLDNGAVDLTNPNKIRALMANYAVNTNAFHAKDGSGYKLVADVVISLNGVNDHTAANIVGSLQQFGRYDEAHQKLMIEQLQRIVKSEPGPQVMDIVGKALKNAPAELKKAAPKAKPAA